MKTILQHDERDCGAACLAMIASHYKLYLTVAKCRELTKTDKQGTNIYGLIDGAGQIGLAAEGQSGSSDELLTSIENKEILFPFIAHVVNESVMFHYIVVVGYKRGRFIIIDPAFGKKYVSESDFFQSWTGRIVTFGKTDYFTPGNYARGGFLKFFRLLEGQWKKLTGIILASLFISMIGIMGAFVFEIVIDNFAIVNEYEEYHNDDHHDDEMVSENGDRIDSLGARISAILLAMQEFVEGISDHLNIIFFSLFALYILKAFIQFARGWLIIQVYRTIDIRLTLQYYNHIVDLPVESLSKRQTGEYLSRFSDSSSIRQAISGATLTLLLDSLMAIVGGIILYMECGRLFYIALGMVVVYAILVLLFKRPVEYSNRRAMEEDARLQSYFKESIDGMEFVKASNAGCEVKKKTRRLFDGFLDAMVKCSIVSVSQDTMVSTVELVGTLIILWIGFSMVLAGQLSIGSLMTFYALLSYFTGPVKNVIELQPTIQSAFVAADRLNDILELSVEKDSNNTQTTEAKMPSQPQSWEVKHVNFRYGNNNLTLQDVNMHINKGERIAIVGESGSGKTTLAKLFLRFFEPECGELLIDGEDISKYDLSALRDSITYVGQNTFLFSDTVRNNLTVGRHEIDQDELERVCQLCSVSDFIDKLPLKYDTPLDENGRNLSGGQRQRLSIARALARQPKLLILDEATSNLDTVTENSIRDSIFQLDREMTCIIIAHRLNTIRSCDRIYVMKNGTVEENGTYDELMARKGEFFRLWNAM